MPSLSIKWEILLTKVNHFPDKTNNPSMMYLSANKNYLILLIDNNNFVESSA